MSDEVEAIIRALHYQGQAIRDEWFAAWEANLGRVQQTLLEAAAFGRDFKHLIPADPRDISPEPPPIPEQGQHGSSWSDIFGRIPGDGDPRPPGGV